jgi:hypothetical protein
MANKIWKTPELIVLLRQKPDEAVLTTCKQASSPATTGYASTRNAGCRTTGCTSDCNNRLVS